MAYPLHELQNCWLFVEPSLTNLFRKTDEETIALLPLGDRIFQRWHVHEHWEDILHTELQVSVRHEDIEN